MSEKKEMSPEEIREQIRKIKEKLENHIPAEVYYAYFLLTTQWLALEELEGQSDFVKESTKKGIRQQMRFKKAMLPPYFEQGKSTLFGMEFDEYVNEAWVSFLENYEISEEYHNDYSKLSEEELDVQPLINNFIQYLNTRYVKSGGKFPYIPLGHILMRSVQNKVENSSYKDSKNKRNFSTDDETSPQSQQEAQSANFEDNILNREAIQSVIKKLDDINQKIVELLQEENSQTEIAKKLGVSNAAISKRMKKISKIIKSELNNQ